MIFKLRKVNFQGHGPADRDRGLELMIMEELIGFGLMIMWELGGFELMIMWDLRGFGLMIISRS